MGHIAVSQRDAADVYQIAARRQMPAHVYVRPVHAHDRIVRRQRRRRVCHARVFAHRRRRPADMSAQLQPPSLILLRIKRLRRRHSPRQPRPLIPAPLPQHNRHFVYLRRRPRQIKRHIRPLGVPRARSQSLAPNLCAIYRAVTIAPIYCACLLHKTYSIAARPFALGN